jgi:PAS domain S-box-containing protein
MSPTNSENEKSLSELLWEYDPNGLVVVDPEMKIKLVNPSFCEMFGVDRENITGTPASQILGDVSNFQKSWNENRVIRIREKEYPDRQIWVKKVIFPIPEQEIVACIMVDITAEMQQRQEMVNFKSETVKKVNEVVDNQMKVAQEIAGLLGETTAETKVSLLKIIEMVEHS